MRVDGILFDKDGTLFDFNATWVVWVERMIEELVAGDEDLRSALAGALGFDLATREFLPSSPVIAGTPEDVAEALEPILGGVMVDQLNEQAANAPQVEAVPLAPLLEYFRAKGLRLGVATNDGEVPARAHLSRAGVDGHFDFIAGSDSGHGGKPEPGMCLAFATSEGLDPARVVMVGDSTHDLSAGRAAGMQVVAVLTGPASAEVLAPMADAVLPDISHLPNWLES
ncbi:MAG: HAD family hydrolase [Maritimibacter sp.]